MGGSCRRLLPREDVAGDPLQRCHPPIKLTPAARPVASDLGVALTAGGAILEIDAL